MTAADLRSDPDAPLPGPPEPWAGSDMPSSRDGPPWHMTEMIEAEPALAARVLESLGRAGSTAARLADAVRATAGRGRPILVAGCGTSEHGAFAVAEILREAMRSTGLPWRLGEAGAPVAVQAFEAALEDELGGPGALVIGVSHEGGTWATNQALERARSSGATVGLVTVSDRSPGAALAELVLTTGEQDQSWCHTVGYLAPILAGVAVAGHLTGKPVDPGTARELLAASLGEAAISATERLARALEHLDRVVVVGSGADRVAARELVLKVEEGAHIPSSMRDLEMVLHGHLAGMDERTGVVLVLSDSTRSTDRGTRATSVLRALYELGCPTGAIVSTGYETAIPAELTGAGRLEVPDAGHMPPVIAALLGTSTPLQLLTERLARERGVNPDPIRRDDPRHLRAAEAAG